MRREMRLIDWSVDKNGCWICTSHKGNINGYPVAKRQGKMQKIANYIKKQQLGIEKTNLLFCHKCNNPSCINPYHIYLGTSKQNAQDRKGNGTYLFGERCPTSRLTESQVKEILESNEKQIYIAKKYNISQPAVSKIRNGGSWSYLQEKKEKKIVQVSVDLDADIYDLIKKLSSKRNKKINDLLVSTINIGLKRKLVYDAKKG